MPRLHVDPQIGKVCEAGGERGEGRGVRAARLVQRAFSQLLAIAAGESCPESSFILPGKTCY